MNCTPGLSTAKPQKTNFHCRDDKPPRVRAQRAEVGVSRSEKDEVEQQKEPVSIKLYKIYNTHPSGVVTGAEPGSRSPNSGHCNNDKTSEEE